MNDIEIIRQRGGNQPDEKSLEGHLKEENIRDQAKKARELFQSLHDELNATEGDIKDGLSYLDMKNDTLLSYMIDLCNIILKKIKGESIVDHPSVERCVEYRVILEKIKAIDLRLTYQLNKLITLPEDATEEDHRIDVNNLDIEIRSDDDDSSGEDDTRQRGKAKLRSIDNHDDEDEDDDEDDDDDDDDDDEDENDDEDEDSKDDAISSDDGGAGEDVKPVGVYKPPKLRSVAYLDNRDKHARKKDYSDFYRDDEGDDIVDESHNRREDEERTRFEEEHYTRLPDNPKKAKRKLKAKASKKFKGKKRRR